MSIEEYNNELTKIKQFYTFLSNILETGYMNELDDLKLLTKQIDNINLINKTADFIDENSDNNDYNDYQDSDYDCIPFIPSSKYNLSSSSSSSSSSSPSSDTEDEEYRLVSKQVSKQVYKQGSNIDKEQEKINRFMTTCTSNDIFQRCGNISLYKANGFDYIDKMKKFVEQSFIY